MEIESIKRVTLNPNDVLVVSASAPISAESAKMLKDRFRDAFPDNTVVVLDNRINLTVMGPNFEDWVDAEHF